MQQYFSPEPLAVGREYQFTKEQEHHARDVVRLHDDTIRLVYQGNAFFAKCTMENGKVRCIVTEADPRINELPFDVTLCMALIRREKFELVLQKAAELGVTRIVPFVSSRCVVSSKAEREKKQNERYAQILEEASRQCKRNRIPEILKPVAFEQLGEYREECSMACYENAFGSARSISSCFAGDRSASIVIGPEGGFSPQEMDLLKNTGFTEITLGSRILRAETAAIYALSILAERGIR